MVTTIQVSGNLLNKLKGLKISNTESYENVIWDLVEDRMELSDETKKNIRISEEQIARGEVISLEELKKELRL
ncbi:hypothetical protein KAJ38_00010 [Candidatus Pacearchaeota archaeon]|nr:hypothetical protein [Candidatus Pacearchaeota archaeon]